MSEAIFLRWQKRGFDSQLLLTDREARSVPIRRKVSAAQLKKVVGIRRMKDLLVLFI